MALGIGALLWVTDPPQDAPVLTDTSALEREELPPLDEVPPPADEAPAAAPTPRATPPPLATLTPRAARPPAPARTPPRAAPAPRATPVRPPVTVLNNSRIEGLAAGAAERVEDVGWPVRLVGDFRGRIPSTTVYYEPGQRRHAQRLADAVGSVSRVRPRFETLPGPRGLTLVVTREFPR